MVMARPKSKHPRKEKVTVSLSTEYDAALERIAAKYGHDEPAKFLARVTEAFIDDALLRERGETDEANYRIRTGDLRFTKRRGNETPGVGVAR